MSTPEIYKGFIVAFYVGNDGEEQFLPIEDYVPFPDHKNWIPQGHFKLGRVSPSAKWNLWCDHVSDSTIFSQLRSMPLRESNK